jgi:hypothetical protein
MKMAQTTKICLISKIISTNAKQAIWDVIPSQVEGFTIAYAMVSKYF